VLHECLTGGQPYPADSVSVVITAHLMSPIPAPSKMRPGIPAAFDDVISRGMAKDPKGRYATAGDLAAAAHDALGSRDQDKADTIVARSSAATIPGVRTPPPTQDPPTTPASFLTPPPRFPPAGSATPPPSGPPPTPPPFAAASIPSPYQPPPAGPTGPGGTGVAGGPPPWQPYASGPMPSAQPPQRNWVPIIIAGAVAFLLVLGGAVAIVLLTNKSGNDKNNAATQTGTTANTTTAESSEPETTTNETTASRPPVTASGKWVVIAYSPATGVFGWSTNGGTKDDASNMAMNACKQYGGTDCQLAAWAPDNCVAVARSDTNWHGGLGPTIQAAESSAIADNKGGTIVVSKCST
jgi:serine/threonine-protein kinase